MLVRKRPLIDFGYPVFKPDNLLGNWRDSQPDHGIPRDLRANKDNRNVLAWAVPWDAVVFNMAIDSIQHRLRQDYFLILFTVLGTAAARVSTTTGHARQHQKEGNEGKTISHDLLPLTINLSDRRRKRPVGCNSD